MIILETDRLTLREVTTEDAEFIYKLLNDPDFLRYIGDRKIRNLDDAKEYISKKMIPNYEAFGFGFYLTKLRENDVSIGICGLVKRPFMEHVDVGFAFLPEYRGSGYAFESASAVLKYATNHLGIDYVVAITDPDNDRSIKLLEKLGLKFSKMIQFDKEDYKCRLFVPAKELNNGA